MLKDYLKNIFDIQERGGAREESYYSALEELLTLFIETTGKRNLYVTTLPKKTETGNPDFRIWDGKVHITGYIEAKSPEIENLDAVENSPQLERYRETFPNLILTNFFEFRLYRNGERIAKVAIGRPFIAHKIKTSPPVENEREFGELLEKFFAFSLPKVYTPKELAAELAKRTRFLKVAVEEELNEEERSNKGFILQFYRTFNEYLITGLSKKEFSDLYSQTITYGLFAARTRSQNGFNRKLAYDNIPLTIGILRDIFRFISLGDIPKQMEWVVDDISDVLAITDVKSILHKYYREGKGSDPIVHFYETFLTEYDPTIRELRGVYYTPEPVVSYIVRSLNEVLKERFERRDGLASDSVTVLDPAAGTLTFIAEAAKVAVEEFVSKYGDGGKDDFIREHILKNFYAFELMMAPYAIGHIKMSFMLEELGYQLEENERFKLYLTNTLDMKELEQTALPGVSSLSEESHSAGEIKREKPILVILGNPPYSGESANRGEWIQEEIRKYYQIDGKPLKERNPRWLQDDYVKFIRFAQWKIDKAGEGILGFITNHAYLDNPTFRGMRKSLMESFDEIYILDLHGSIKRKEKASDGSKDESVFHIKQGTSIGIFIKHKERGKGCKIFHCDLLGKQEKKYTWLFNHCVNNTKWKSLKPKSEYYLFIPIKEKYLKSYEKNPKITDIFVANSVGIVTARDNLTIKFTAEEIWNTVRRFAKMEPELARRAFNLGMDAKDWKVKDARRDVTESGPLKENIKPILYRPFDKRYTYYTGKSRGFHCRPRDNVMKHILQSNVGLITIRRSRSRETWNYAFATDILISGATAISALDINYLFPLYLYPDGKLPNGLFDYDNGKKPNFSDKFLNALLGSYKAELSVSKPSNPKRQLLPEEIFYYVYAILYSNLYRSKYSEFLKLDFPRIPFPESYKLFCKAAEFGKKLVEMHTLASKELDSPVAKFQGKGDNSLKKTIFDEKQKRLYINDSQYFEGVEKEVWEYYIGGYQVCEKWLKERSGQQLSLEEIMHSLKIVTAVQKTIELQNEMDSLFPEIEENSIDF
ncbi:MAG: DNA methyltransferase [Myxococcota bacterium]